MICISYTIIASLTIRIQYVLLKRKQDVLWMIDPAFRQANTASMLMQWGRKQIVFLLGCLISRSGIAQRWKQKSLATMQVKMEIMIIGLPERYEWLPMFGMKWRSGPTIFYRVRASIRIQFWRMSGLDQSQHEVREKDHWPESQAQLLGTTLVPEVTTRRVLIHPTELHRTKLTVENKSRIIKPSPRLKRKERISTKIQKMIWENFRSKYGEIWLAKLEQRWR